MVREAAGGERPEGVHEGLVDRPLDLAQADATGTVQTVRGIALNNAAAGRPVNVLERGSVYGFTLTSLDPGTQLFVSEATAGAIVDTAPSTATQFIVPIGEVRAIFEGTTAVKVVRIAINQAHVAYEEISA